MSNKANSCPCCGSLLLLRHVRQSQIYWFCQSCRQEVPLLTVLRLSDMEVTNSKLRPQVTVNS